MRLEGIPELLHSHIGLATKLRYDDVEAENPHGRKNGWRDTSRTYVTLEAMVELPPHDPDVPAEKVPILSTFYTLPNGALENEFEYPVDKLTEWTGYREIIQGLSTAIPVVDKDRWQNEEWDYPEAVDDVIRIARRNIRNRFTNIQELTQNNAIWHLSQEVIDNQFDRATHEEVLKANGYDINVAGRYLAGASVMIQPNRNRVPTFLKFKNPWAWSSAMPDRCLALVEAGDPDIASFTYGKDFTINGLGARAFTDGPNVGLSSWFIMRLSVFTASAMLSFRRMQPFMRSWAYNFQEAQNMLRELGEQYGIENKTFYVPDHNENRPKSVMLYIPPEQHNPKTCDICTPQMSFDEKDYEIDRSELKTILYRQLGVNA